MKSDLPQKGAKDLSVQNFTIPCDCARKGTAKLGHYDVVRCPNCNCQFWALQPRRDGPLVIFPWPGVAARPAYER